ncbi:MAG: lipoate---protein ligase [Pseudonocardiales bacterium]|nr:lipoate---protein ligase [Pseudonocardiales bacterium]
MSRAAGSELVAALPDPLPASVVQVVEVGHSVLVLGSRQGIETADVGAAQAAGVDVVRRHSGGGAVLLHPGRSLWLDVLLPRSHELWSDDVALAFHWLGEVWVDALADVGVDAAVHRGGLDKTPWGSLICFGSIGAGEVSVDGRKVVGMSQRRTRGGARFQCLVHDDWDPDELLTMLALTPDERDAAAEDLLPRAAGPGAPLADLEESVLTRLGHLG